MTDHKCQLEVETDLGRYPCDGCGILMEQGSLIIGNIDSCCGGCTRALCAECIKAAAKMIEDAENKVAGIVTIEGINPNSYTTASAAVSDMLRSQGFDTAVVNAGWIELKIVASFQDKGAMLQTLSVVPFVPAGQLADNEAAKSGLFLEALEERAQQDEQWGGPAHDDTHNEDDWAGFIEHQTHRVPLEGEARQRFVKIMALAIAAIESIDRRAES